MIEYVDPGAFRVPVDEGSGKRSAKHVRHNVGQCSILPILWSQVPCIVILSGVHPTDFKSMLSFIYAPAEEPRLTNFFRV